MSRPRSFSLWNPKRHSLVRVAFGPGRGALGIVRQKRSRWGVTLIEVEMTSAKRPGEWLEVSSWRLSPVREKRVIVLTDGSAETHAEEDRLPVGA